MTKISKEQLLSLCKQFRAVLVDFEKYTVPVEGNRVTVYHLVVIDKETGMKYEYCE